MTKDSMPVTPGRFGNLREYEALCEWLRQNEDWEEIEVGEPKTDVGLNETWYRCSTSGKVWRLIEPDAPFQGMREQVSN